MIKWLEKQFKRLTRGVNLKKLRLAIKQLNCCLSKKRKIIVLKRWSQLPRNTNAVYMQCGANMYSELEKELGWQIFSNLSEELVKKIGEEKTLKIRKEFVKRMAGNIWDSLYDEFMEEFKKLWCVWEHFYTIWAVFISIFFPELETIKKNRKIIKIFKKIINAGGCYLMLNKTKLFVIPFPQIKVLDKKLHSERGYALKWLNKKSYWLYGIKFRGDVWKKIITKSLTLKEVLKIRNIEQRMVAIKYVGEKILKWAKLIHRSERGNELYMVEKVFSTPAYFLKYKDPSTGRIYISGIDPKFAKKYPTADDCMAWKFGITTSEYLQLENET